MKIYLKVISMLLFPLLISGQQEKPYLSSLYRSLSDAANDTVRMNIYRSLGFYYMLEDRDSTNLYLEKALPIAVRLNLKFDQVTILAGMGIVLMQQDKFSKSLEFYLKALHIAKDPSVEKTMWGLSPGKSPRQERMKAIARTYDLIGLLNAYTGNWEDNINNQLKNYREAENYAKAAGDKGIIAALNFHKGIAYMNAGKFDSALLLIERAQSVFSDLKDPQLGRTMLYQGDTYKRMGNFDLAAHTILKGMALLNETNDYVHRGQGYTLLSSVYAGLKKTDSALYYAKESLKIFEKRKDPVGKKDAYNLLASYFDNLGRTDSATAYLKLAKSLSDSLSVEERKNLLAFQDVVVDEQAKLEKLEKEKIETREKLRIYLLMSGIVVFIVIVFLLYRNNRHRKKTNETLRQRNEKIENTLHQLRSTQAQLIQSEKMASLGQLTAGIAHEIQNPLNFVNNFSDVNKELLVELKDEVKKGNLDEVNAIADDIISNEEKINHHGKRADAIVKGMLQHSRSSSGKKEPADINELCDEYLRLSYHGLRAKDKSFNATMKTDFDNSIGKINIAPQEIGRVILNLINNAFYAVDEKKKKSGDNYESIVTVTTRSVKSPSGDLGAEIKIADNGNGIPQKILDKIFQPFFTTKPTGQGTGLGLSLSYDIVKTHGGELKVETKEGEGSEFIIHLPLNTSANEK
jgi:two-component system, NtrC family, sensor kinase